jgi:hypothetical protein
MLPDLSNTMYMSTGAKQLPPLVPLAPPLVPEAPLVPKPPLLVPPPLLPLLPLAPPELKLESGSDEPHAMARRRVHEIAAMDARRAGDLMLQIVPHGTVPCRQRAHDDGHTAAHAERMVSAETVRGSILIHVEDAAAVLELGAACEDDRRVVGEGAERARRCDVRVQFQGLAKRSALMSNGSRPIRHSGEGAGNAARTPLTNIPEDLMDTALASPPVTTTTTTGTSRVGVWTGRVVTGLIVAFLLVDAGAKLVPLAPVVEASQKLGISLDVVRTLGLVLAVSTVLHVIRRTQLLGAVLVTAYLGGATATHVNSGTPFWFPVAMGVLLWIAYGLRSPQLRALVLSTR